MATNITTRHNNSNKEIFIFQQATPDNWGDGEPPSPVEFYDSIAFTGKPQTKGKTKTLHEKQECPCGGGMSCLVDRRTSGVWVMEDDVFKKAKCKLRINCLDPMSKFQIKLMKQAWRVN
jgi:hypothetical protein